jgi:DNA-binding Xre family transcriptional regulator
MNAIQTLQERVRERFPAVTTTLDPSSKPAGAWFLDLDLNGQLVTVEWRPGRGFGITSKRLPGYGEGPDELVPDLESISRRVINLLLAQAQTQPPKAVRLRELRSARGLSQVELAKRLRINQAAVSKLEKRSDLRLRTLRDVVEALGGKLVIRALFPDGERELCFDDEGPAAEVTATRRGGQRQGP